MQTSVMPATAHPLLTHIVGSTTGAALAVLINVYVGAPFERPIAFVVAAALAGLAAAYFFGDRVRLSGAPAILALVAWAILVLSALVFVVAAIALSNFE